MMRRIWAGLAVIAGLAVAACHPAPKGVDAARLAAADSDANE